MNQEVFNMSVESVLIYSPVLFCILVIIGGSASLISLMQSFIVRNCFMLRTTYLCFFVSTILGCWVLCVNIERHELVRTVNVFEFIDICEELGEEPVIQGEYINRECGFEIINITDIYIAMIEREGQHE